MKVSIKIIVEIKLEELKSKRDDPEKIRKEARKRIEELKTIWKENLKCKPKSISIKIGKKETKISTYEDIQKLENNIYYFLGGK